MRGQWGRAWGQPAAGLGGQRGGCFGQLVAHQHSPLLGGRRKVGTRVTQRGSQSVRNLALSRDRLGAASHPLAPSRAVGPLPWGSAGISETLYPLSSPPNFLWLAHPGNSGKTVPLLRRRIFPPLLPVPVDSSLPHVSQTRDHTARGLFCWPHTQRSVCLCRIPLHGCEVGAFAPVFGED